MQEGVKKAPIIVAVVFLLLLGAVFAFFTAKRNTVSPLPEEGVRVIFVSPMPSETAAPPATPSATPKVKSSPTPTAKPKATPTPSTTTPTPAATASLTPTQTPK